MWYEMGCKNCIQNVVSKPEGKDLDLDEIRIRERKRRTSGGRD